nr:flagellar export chaperone FliS [uncultured Holophaga sp.]
MQTAYGGNANNHYLTQKINGATPEQLMILLLEGGQRFMTQAIDAIRKRDIPLKARMVNRVSAIIEELAVQLNLDEGGELVANLSSLYDWWLFELFEASQKNDTGRMEGILRQMGDMRNTWQELDRSREQPARPSLSAEGLVG